MSSPALSVIVPARNEAVPLRRLLDALAVSRHPSFEVIVASDASTDGTDDVARAAGARVERLNRRGGPAAARNRGARAAEAPFLVFLDADVVPHPELLLRIEAHRAADPELRCFTGSYSREPAVDGWFQRYRALLSRSYHASRPSKSRTTLLETAVAGMEASLFRELGGFDEGATGRDVEDTELGRRISRVAPIHLLADVEVRHEYPSFRATFRNYRRRTAAWIRLAASGARGFDDRVTTRGTAGRRLLGAATCLATVAAVVMPPLWPLALALHATHLVASRRLAVLLVRHAPLADLPLALAADLLLGLAVLWGAVIGASSVAASRLRAIQIKTGG